jgi:hypothetical protein
LALSDSRLPAHAINLAEKKILTVIAITKCGTISELRNPSSDKRCSYSCIPALAEWKCRMSADEAGYDAIISCATVGGLRFREIFRAAQRLINKKAGLNRPAFLS